MKSATKRLNSRLPYLVVLLSAGGRESALRTGVVENCRSHIKSPRHECHIWLSESKRNLQLTTNNSAAQWPSGDHVCFVNKTSLDQPSCRAAWLVHLASHSPTGGKFREAIGFVREPKTGELSPWSPTLVKYRLQYNPQGSCRAKKCIRDKEPPPGKKKKKKKKTQTSQVSVSLCRKLDAVSGPTLSGHEEQFEKRVASTFS